MKRWSVGAMERWSDGALERWSVAAMERWSDEALQRSNVDRRSNAPPLTPFQRFFAPIQAPFRNSAQKEQSSYSFRIG
jgi:hypothetical protein